MKKQTVHIEEKNILNRRVDFATHQRSLDDSDLNLFSTFYICEGMAYNAIHEIDLLINIADNSTYVNQ